ncbi:hypothetical protein [Streptomyces endophyticus]|uniref:hypothetical protein n=1 Tax=Streptomyces endophyticus TaxID=714166 RepID=UPI00389AB2FE
MRCRTGKDARRLRVRAHWGTPGRSGYTDLLIAHCRHAGFDPHVERTDRQGTPPVTAAIGTRRIAFVTAPPGVAAGGRAHVIALEPPVHAPVHAPLHALYSANTTSAGRDMFLTSAARP